MMIIKFGGSVTTFKNRMVPRINEETLRKLSKELSESWDRKEKLILLHGAGSYGHPLARLVKTIDKRKYHYGYAEIQLIQNKLNVEFCDILQDYGIPATPFQPIGVMEDGKLVKLDLESLKGLIEKRIVPVLYGTPSYDRIHGFSILSGDEIIRYLADNLEIRKIIHVTDVDGVFDRDPKKFEHAKLIRKMTKDEIEKLVDVSSSENIDVSGGMEKKIKEIMKIKRKVKVYIINGFSSGNLKKAINDEEVGTIIET